MVTVVIHGHLLGQNFHLIYGNIHLVNEFLSFIFPFSSLLLFPSFQYTYRRYLLCTIQLHSNELTSPRICYWQKFLYDGGPRALSGLTGLASGSQHFLPAQCCGRFYLYFSQDNEDELL